MDKIIKFFIEVGKLKRIPRQGWVIREVKDPESIAEHAFRGAIMAWILAEKRNEKLDLEKLLKMALIHDLCEVYAGDTTPYDSILPKDKKARRKLLKTWPRFSEKEKKALADKKFKKEKAGLEKLIKDLPSKLKQEIMSLWLDYERGVSREGRFFRRADRIENFLQAEEYGDPVDPRPYWVQADELHDDPVLLEFMEQIDKEFYNGKKKK